MVNVFFLADFPGVKTSHQFVGHNDIIKEAFGLYQRGIRSTNMRLLLELMACIPPTLAKVTPFTEVQGSTVGHSQRLNSLRLSGEGLERKGGKSRKRLNA